MKGPENSGFLPMVLWVVPGEGIGEAILSHIHNRENFPAHLKEKTCIGVIMSALGNVLNPELDILESSMLDDGVYEIISLNGAYDIPKDGDARVSAGLCASLSDGPGRAFGGPVIGPLVAATTIQLVLFIAEVTENTYFPPEN